MEYQNYYTHIDEDIKELLLEDVVLNVMKDLKSYGNIINDNKYIDAIRITVDNIMFYDDTKVVNVIPLPTGCGKSTAMINTISYMTSNKVLNQYSGTVILRLYQSDCDETADEINKKSNKEVAYSYHSGNNKNKISFRTLEKYPVLVMTHEGFRRMIDNNELKQLQVWTDKKINKQTGKTNKFYRQRLIIDEEIKNVKFFNITMATISTLENAILNMGNNELYEEFVRFILDIKREFLKPYDIRKNKMIFVSFEGISIPSKLEEAIYDCKDQKAKESMEAIVSLLAHGGYLRYSDSIENKCLTTYQFLDINSPLFSQVILDATAGVTHTYKINKQFNIVDIPTVKTYKNTTIHIFNGITGSKKSLENNFEDGLFDKFVENLVTTTTEKDEVLVVVNNKDYEDKIKERLEEINFIYQDNINYSHYGKTIGVNYWSKCNKLFVLGLNLMDDPQSPILYYLNTISKEELKPSDFNTLDTTMTAKSGARRFLENEFEQIRLSLASNVLIQTLNRIHCRQYVNGDTPETHIYIINKDKEIDNIVKQAMPDVNILYDWNMDYESKSGKSIERKATTEEKIISLLQSIIEDDEYRQKLIDEGKYSVEKGIKKTIIREILGINSRTTMNKGFASPLFLQFCNDNNIQINNINSKYIKI